MTQNRSKLNGTAVLLVAFLFVSAACQDGFGGLLISDADEVEIGLSVDQSIESEYRLVADSDPLAQWARDLVNPLQNASASFRDPAGFGGFKVEVIADDELVNAFAGPGGFTYITTGLILAAATCAEPAGVMSHELAHVTQRHSVKSIEGSFAVQQLSSWLLGDGIAGDGLVFINDFLSSTQFSQEHELEADDVGLQIAQAAGYNPYGFVDFFEKLAAMEGGVSMPSFFSSHPPTGDRIQAAISRIESTWPEVQRNGSGYDCIGTSMSLQQAQELVRSGNYALR